MTKLSYAIPSRKIQWQVKDLQMDPDKPGWWYATLTDGSDETQDVRRNFKAKNRVEAWSFLQKECMKRNERLKEMSVMRPGKTNNFNYHKPEGSGDQHTEEGTLSGTPTSKDSDRRGSPRS